MTVIAAYDDGKRVWIASDSAGSDDWATFDLGSKIIKKGDYYIGFTSSYRTADIIREATNLPSTITGIKDVRIFRNRLTKLMLKSGGEITGERGELIKHPVGLVIISQTGIYTILEDYQIHKVSEGYYSVGSGYLVALGVLHFAKSRKLEDGKQAVKGAILAAISHITTCGGKCYIKSISKEKKIESQNS